MYLFSTLAIGCSMLIAAVCWKRVTVLIDNRAVVVSFGLFATIATALLGFSPILGHTSFIICAICTGLGTSFLCLKVGRIYGSVSLSDSLTAGAVSLIFAGLLYFVGIGISLDVRLFYIALLPLISALLLALRSPDLIEGFEAVTDTGGAQPTASGGVQAARSFERKLIVRLSIASALIAIVAGIGKGLSSSISASETFAQQGIETVFAIMVIAVFIIVAINKQNIRRGVYQVYSGLMVIGIAMLLASPFGFPLAYLSIGKESLWLVLSCFMTYIAFRFDLSPIWVFGIGQASYFLSSTAGWVIGFVLSGQYYDGLLQNTAGFALAFLVVLVLVYVFNGKDLSRITSLSVKGMSDGLDEPNDISSDGLFGKDNQALSLLADTQSKLGLSDREIEVMRLFAQGRSASWIADTLIVSTSTVRSHIRAVYIKTGVHSRQELLDFLTQGKK
jgi:DNA-binding CsgD family transcriptional regulator